MSARREYGLVETGDGRWHVVMKKPDGSFSDSLGEHRTRKQAKAAIAEHRLADEFNEKCPMGTDVEYWTWAREGAGKLGTTRSFAIVQSSGHAVVWLVGVPGCIAVTHVRPLTAAEAAAAKDMPPDILRALTNPGLHCGPDPRKVG